MMKMLTAGTLEADEPKIAAQEILDQLKLEENLLANSAAYITCSYDFIESGALEAVCAALPMDVVGCTTLMNATAEEAGTMALCVSVLTGDDCQFSAVASQPLTNGLGEPIREAYERGLKALPQPPSLILLFAPMIRTIGGELILNELDAISGGVPIFGTIGCDRDTSEYLQTYTLHNGRAMRESLSMLLISGELSPRFYVTSTSEDNAQQQSAIITQSEGSVLMRVNDVTAAQYMEGIGLTIGSGVEASSAIPFMVNYNDGTKPVARAIYMLTPEGYAVCGGAMPVNATLTVGSIEYEDIMLTARSTVTEALESGKRGGLILFPCLGRNMVLGADLYAEIDVVRECVGRELPFHLAYSGGEISPLYDEGGAAHNRFHNFTFIACIF